MADNHRMTNNEIMRELTIESTLTKIPRRKEFIGRALHEIRMVGPSNRPMFLLLERCVLLRTGWLFWHQRVVNTRHFLSASHHLTGIPKFVVVPNV